MNGPSSGTHDGSQSHSSRRSSIMTTRVGIRRLAWVAEAVSRKRRATVGWHPNVAGNRAKPPRSHPAREAARRRCRCTARGRARSRSDARTRPEDPLKVLSSTRSTLVAQRTRRQHRPQRRQPVSISRRPDHPFHRLGGGTALGRVCDPWRQRLHPADEGGRGSRCQA